MSEAFVVFDHEKKFRSMFTSLFAAEQSLAVSIPNLEEVYRSKDFSTFKSGHDVYTIKLLPIHTEAQVI